VRVINLKEDMRRTMSPQIAWRRCRIAAIFANRGGMNRPCFLVLQGENTAVPNEAENYSLFRKHETWERFMKAGRVVLAVIAIAALTSAQAEARTHHRHSHYGCHQYDDYTHGNALSVGSYVYPAANWGPFFHCRMYYAPVFVPPAAPY
jgi:hypothetical protein